MAERNPMLRWLFGKSKDQAARGDDHVWTTPAARGRGLVRLVAAAVAEGAGVVVVVPTRTALDEATASLVSFQPTSVADVRGKSALRDGLRRGGTVAVALAGSLPADVDPLAGTRVEIVVAGRADRRAADDAIVAFADALGPGARVTFHLTLEDPLLQGFDAQIGELLTRLGASDDEPITHAFLTRAIANAQAKRAG